MRLLWSLLLASVLLTVAGLCFADDGYTYREVYYASEVTIFKTPVNKVHLPNYVEAERFTTFEVWWRDPTALPVGEPIPWAPHRSFTLVDSFTTEQIDTTLLFNRGSRSYAITLVHGGNSRDTCVRVIAWNLTTKSDSGKPELDVGFTGMSPCVGNMAFEVHILSHFDPALNAVPLPTPTNPPNWSFRDKTEERDGEIVDPDLVPDVVETPPPTETVAPSSPHTLYQHKPDGLRERLGPFWTVVVLIALGLIFIKITAMTIRTAWFGLTSSSRMRDADSSTTPSPPIVYGGGGGGGGSSGSGSSSSNTGYEGGGSGSYEPSNSGGSAIDRVTGSSVYGSISGIGSDSALARIDSDGRQTANDGFIPGVGGTHQGTWQQEGSSAVLRDSGFGGGSAKLSIDSDGNVTKPGMFGSLDAERVGKMDSDGTIRDSFGNIVGKIEQ